MGLFRGEQDPIIAFMHDDANPRDATINSLGQIVAHKEGDGIRQEVHYGPPSPVMLVDTSRDTEITVLGKTEDVIDKLFEPQIDVRRVQEESQLRHVRRALQRLIPVFPRVNPSSPAADTSR